MNNMKTENEEGVNGEEEQNVPQQQTEDKEDKFSDQEEDDDFYKIQIDNFRNRTPSNFHKNVR